jgi:Mrp family chromosome partitioning ATPase
VEDRLELQRGVAAEVAPVRPTPPGREFQPVISMSINARADAFQLNRQISPLLGKLRNAMAKGGGVVVHLTSAERGDGVSTIAREFAVAAAAIPFCRVLLLSCLDLDDSRAGAFGPPLPDLVSSYLLRGEGEVASIAVGNSIFHASALSPSFEPRGGADCSRTVEELYAGLRSAYDLLIVDCPPILHAPYFVRVAQETPEVLLVVEAEKTRIPAVIRAKDEIALAGGRLVGVVLNKRRVYLPGFLQRRL